MDNSLKTGRIMTLVRCLCDGLKEREETMTVALLAVLAGQSVFLLGPPGTAKSLMARRISCAFTDSRHFEYLMQKFSTPEEIFGPIDIAQLKQGNYVRKIKGYLPEADFAFLDERWKSNPPILNTLLTITNEKIFRNGDRIEKVPLKGLIGASNETPPKGEGLEALWDRFVVRLEVPPLANRSSFEGLLQNSRVESEIQVDKKLAITNAEWELWQKDIDAVRLSEEVLEVIHVIKGQLIELDRKREPGEESLYVSDRRWLRAVMLLKSSAYFSDRTVVNLQDALMLRHCLWSTTANREQIEKIVVDAVAAGYSAEINLYKIDTLIDESEKLFSNDINATQCFELNQDVFDSLPTGIKNRISDRKIYIRQERSQ